ncbi:MAG: SUMF1/EgtB/PvdO family nonheme iron enzyme, partial [Cyanobacteria bacterium J06559_3]
MISPQTHPPTITLQKRQGENQYVDEVLAEGLWLRLMLIPAGRFQMGSPEDELDRSNEEGPLHEVSIPSFTMGKYPVTQAQWRFVA